jgi:hypothetical protein
VADGLYRGASVEAVVAVEGMQRGILMAFVLERDGKGLCYIGVVL